MDTFSVLQLSILKMGWVHAQKQTYFGNTCFLFLTLGPGKSKTLGNFHLLVSIRDK